MSAMLAPGQDVDEAADHAHDPVEPGVRRSPEEKARLARQINDPWAAYLTVDGRCQECGARYRHATRCSIAGGPGYVAPDPAWCSFPGCTDGNAWHEHPAPVAAA